VLVLAAVACADEFALLQSQIKESAKWNQERLAKEALRPEALILPSDKTPGDIVWRRTAALLRHLKTMERAPDLSAEEKELDALKAATVSREGFDKIVSLRRRIAFKNPLLDFDKIVFLKHNKQVRGERHMVDQYFGFNAEKAGGVYVLENAFSHQPQVRPLLEKPGGYIALELDYDARTLLFAFTEAEYQLPPGITYDPNVWSEADAKRDPKHAFYHFRAETCYHLFKMDVNGSSLTQLTDGPFNDFDPCFLPNGRIAFISTRCGGQLRCGFRPDPTYTLHAMQPDGSDIIPLSYHETHEWHPSVDNNGMIVYTRWDYVDRDSDVAHHIWHCYPDGRDPRSYHGNYPERREFRPWMEMSCRAVPNSQKYIAVTGAHHGQAYGTLVMIDRREKDDRSTSQIKRLTPEVPFAESESAPGVPHAKGKHSPNAEVYGTPWPLSEDFHLVVYDPDKKNYGLYLLDSFGNRELLYRDDKIACLDPIPLKPRLRPPVLPVQTVQAKADRPPDADLSTGTVMVMNVYESDQPWPPNTKIKALRVINLFPKENSIANEPYIGHAAQSLARGVLGTAPVEEDGSAYFKVPTGAAIYFQALNENGLAVQNMRSDTYLHPGENLTCVGCHEPKHTSVSNTEGNQPLAIKRPPSKLQPEPTGSYPLTFPRLVQPVLDAKCLPCHEKRALTAPCLRSDLFGKNGWSESFITLNKRAWGMSGGNGVALKEPQYSIPGQVGAMASSLYVMLTRGHNNVKLSPEQMRRITLWLDCNSNFYGAYRDIEKQARGEIVRPKWGVPAWMDFAALAR
jgi:ABC-type molybdate transport system substrate-binding protein